jgi:large subunit ribosomal protein L18
MIIFMKNNIKNTKTAKRVRRHNKIRAKIFGTNTRPRLSVYKSNRYIHAQLIDDVKQKSIIGLVSAEQIVKVSGKSEQAKKTGELLAQRALSKKITKVVFDRGGFKYVGRIKAFSDSAKSAGLIF